MWKHLEHGNLSRCEQKGKFRKRSWGELSLRLEDGNLKIKEYIHIYIWSIDKVAQGQCE